MSILLDANDNNQVDHASVLRVDLGIQNRSMFIFSGIARPEWRINDDSNIYEESVVVNLRRPVMAVEQATITVGLASFGNGDTDFQFACNSTSLDIDPNSQELLLNVDLALEGDPSTLNRFGYQIVTIVTTQVTGISGVVRWDKGVFDASSLTQGEVAQLFLIAANQQVTLPPPPGGKFGSITYTPVAYGTTSSLRTEKRDFVLPYNIPGAPYNQPLVVTVQVNPPFKASGIAAANQIAGPDPVVLTVQNPGVTGVDFRVTATIVK